MWLQVPKPASVTTVALNAGQVDPHRPTVRHHKGRCQKLPDGTVPNTAVVASAQDLSETSVRNILRGNPGTCGGGLPVFVPDVSRLTAWVQAITAEFIILNTKFLVF